MTASAAQAAVSPSLLIQAPASVQVGDRIEIQLIVKNAHNLGGYEGQLLFDASAAHFSGIHQRNSDLKKFGRDVIPLEEPNLPDGIAIGLASCPYPNCVQLKGTPQLSGANGTVRLATIEIGTDKAGLLELRFDHLKFVDANGNITPVNVPAATIHVQVGAKNGVTFTAPNSTWQWSASAPKQAKVDVTGDGRVNYADATEVAIEWRLARERGQPCGPTNDLTRDVNGDGCIDVADVQLVLANTAKSSPSTQPAQPGNSTTTAGSAAKQATSPLTFTVNSTADIDDSNIGDGICASSAGCTLRAAIEEANAHSGPDTIAFNIAGTGVQTIQLTNRLPSLWDSSGGTTIDAYSQPGAQANTDSFVSNAQLMIQLQGGGPTAYDAMVIQSAGNRVQGLSLFNLRRGIWVYGSGATNNVLTGNFLGTNAAGTFGLTTSGLSDYGIEIEAGASSNRVGGTTPAERNILSGNGRMGLDFNGDATDHNVVYNNIMGLNPVGTGRLPNLRHGIDMNSGPSMNIIGGTGAGQRNILSGNGANDAGDWSGIEISHGTTTQQNQVIGNCIGTDATCTSGPSWASNMHYGVDLEDGVNGNIIAYNVIGNCPNGGIYVTGKGVNLNQIHDNVIGLSSNNTPIPNGAFGIQLAGWAQSNTIGPNNIITNSATGVQVVDIETWYDTITQNSIFNNSLLGIDLGPASGVTPNDSGDTDTGPNQVLNFPVLTSATTSSVTGTACADSGVPKPCTIEVFVADRVLSDTGGGNYGQGKTFVGSGTTDASGAFTISLTGVTAGQYLTATATDARGDTSEFSQNILASGGTTGTTYASDQFSRTVTDSWGSADIGGTYTLYGTAANFDVNGSSGTITMPSTNISRSALLRSVSAPDTNIVFRFKTDKLASGGAYAAYFVARSVSSNTEYVGQIRLTTSQTVNLRAVKFVNGTSTFLGTEVQVSGLTHAANSYIWVHAQVVGTSPTTIQLKAWADGQSEPANWQYTVTDSDPNLQTAGAVGLRTFLPSTVTNAPVVFTFDDFLVTSP